MVLDRDNHVGMQNYMLSRSAICNFLSFSVTVHFSSHRWDANPVIRYDITAMWKKTPNPSQSHNWFPDDSVWHSCPVELPLTHKPLVSVAPLHPSWKVGHDLCIIRYTMGCEVKRERRNTTVWQSIKQLPQCYWPWDCYGSTITTTDMWFRVSDTLTSIGETLQMSETTSRLNNI